jgi:AcrR family transcriptional regulator
LSDPRTAIKPEYIRRAIMAYAAGAGISMNDVALRCKVERSYFYRWLRDADNWPAISVACEGYEGWLEMRAAELQARYGEVTP